MSWVSLSVAPVWLFALIGAVLVGLFAGPAFLVWLPVVAVGSILLTFLLQISLQRKEALVTRIIASLGGMLAVLSVATVVLALLHPDAIGRLAS